MRLSITNAIHNVGQKAFHTLLETGAFPKVNFSKTTNADGYTWTSYSMFHYSDAWATFMKILDIWMKQENLDKRLGVFTRKHSAKFLEDVARLANDITVEDMNDQHVRFHTWLDEL